MTCHRGSWRYLAVLTCALIGAASGQQTYEPVGGQHGTSYPGACPLDKWTDVIVTVVATLPESTTGPLSVRCHTLCTSMSVLLPLCELRGWCAGPCSLRTPRIPTILTETPSLASPPALHGTSS